jgi:hypothetical protein
VIGMLVAATTLMDTATNVERYVRGNLAGGVDHLVVFLDAPGAPGQDEVRDLLDGHEHVTCVRAGRGWWGEHRPARLNERQCTNANLVKHLVAQAPVAGEDDWVAHLDGDEIARIDRALLDAVPRTVDALHLQVREVASREQWSGEPDLFKHLLGPGDLDLLHRRGGIPQPTNQDYFHGHLLGKSVVRADAAAWLTLHRVVDDEGREVEGYADEGLEVFHLESYSATEFVRKWSALARSGPRVSFRPARGEVARAVSELLAQDLAEPDRDQLLRELYRRHVHDDVALLDSLGLLRRVDLATPRNPGRHPRPRPDAVRQVAAGLERWRGRPKQEFFRGASVKDGRVPSAAAPGRGRRPRAR